MPPIIIFSITDMLGIVIAGFCPLPLIAGASGIVFAVFFIFRKKIWMAGLLSMSVLFFMVGVLTMKNFLTLPEDDISRWNVLFMRGPVAVLGVVDSDVECQTVGKRLKTTFYLRPLLVARGDHCFRVSGELLVNLFRKTGVRYGDRILLKTKIHYPFDDDTKPSSYADYLARNGVRYIATVGKDGILKKVGEGHGNFIVAQLYQTRHFFIDRFYRFLSPVEAGFMTALLLGARYDMTDAIQSMFVRTGTVHVIAISGLHIILIAAVFLMAFRVMRLPRNTQFLLLIILITAYGVMAGGRASVARAVVMCACLSVGKMIEREGGTLATLAVCCIGILLFTPQYLFDVGFQLSFLCVLMIVMMAAWIQERLGVFPATRGRLGRFLVESVSISIAVWIGIWPLIAYYFQMITPVSVLANIVIVPLSSLLIMLGLGLMLCAAVPGLGYLAGCFAVCVKAVLAATISADYFFVNLPGGYFFVRDTALWQVIAYYAVFIVLFWGAKIFYRRKN